MRIEIQGVAKQGKRIALCFDVSNPFDGEGEWLRGNLHCHVRTMGGAEACCALYRGLGFDFLAATDYATVAPMPPPTRDFLTLEGAEMSGAGKAHLVCIGLTRDLVPARGWPDDLGRMIADAREQGGLAILAHPYWSDFECAELLQVARLGIAGIEISNRLAWRINGKERAEALWQMLAASGVPLSPIGVDDAHATPDLDPHVVGRTWTGAWVRERTREGLLDAIRSGRTYASEGPHLRTVRFEPHGVIVAECSECVACHFMSRGGGVRTILAAEGAERFEVDLRQEGYRLRDWLAVCLEDRDGRRAWSAAIPVRAKVRELEGGEENE